MEYTLPSLEMITNIADGPSEMNLAALQSVIEVYIIVYLKIFIPGANVLRFIAAITSFPSTQKWTTRKLTILKCIIFITIKYEDAVDIVE